MTARLGECSRLLQRRSQRVVGLRIVAGEPDRVAKLRDRAGAVACFDPLLPGADRKGGGLRVCLSFVQPVSLDPRCAGSLHIALLLKRL